MRKTSHHRHKLPIKVGCRLAVLLLAVLSSADAEQLPIKPYTSADGLARDDINRIVRDGRSYLRFWAK